jgi:hypothetical protein
MTALLLPGLLGMTGLVIDGGLMMGAQRQTQNAADAAAIAAATSMLNGNSFISATSDATTYVNTYNGLAAASLVLNNPPSTGPFAGNANYVEAIVTYPCHTLFMEVLGVNPNQSVVARAVAGYKAVNGNIGLAAFDPAGQPGFTMIGPGHVTVNGKVVVNSESAGFDQNGGYVSLGQPPHAIQNGHDNALYAQEVDVVGGVDYPANFLPLPGNSGSPLKAGGLPVSDPLLSIPVPTTSNGVANQYWSINSSGQPVAATSPQIVNISLKSSLNVTLNPGIYQQIVIGGSAGTATFNPGTYVLMGGSGGTALSISGGGTVTGNGVMFYNTGSDFNVATGLPDKNDGATFGTDPNATFGSVSIDGTGGSITLSPMSGTPGSFNGMLVYQRPYNTQLLTLAGSSSQTNVSGTFYAPWAPMLLSRLGGTYNAQFLAGTLKEFQMSNDVTINPTGTGLAMGSQVYLVE